MWISRYVCLFILYSLAGWVYETAYCTVRSGKWENRGFLYGPVCPIYGVGATAISLVISIARANSITLEPWAIFTISVIGSAVLEYSTSWALEKLFHAVWWDYSNLPLNINGRISLFTSLGFGAAGLLVVYRIAPFTEDLMEKLSALAAEFMALVSVFIFAVDITLTVSALLNFDKMVIRIKDNFNQNMDLLVDDAVVRTARIKQEFLENKAAADLQLRAMGAFARTAIRRAAFFRDNDKDKEAVRNRIMSILKIKSPGGSQK